MSEFLKFICKLKKHDLYFSIRSTREDAISVDVTVPGAIWEVDFLDDGSVDVEIYKSTGIHNIDELDKLWDLAD